MGLGDEIMAAGHAQVVYEADPTRRVAICDTQGNVRSHSVWQNNPVIAGPQYARTKEVTRIVNAVGARPYIRYPYSHDAPCRFTSWRARDHVGRVYLTRGDETVARQHAARRPYVLIEPSLKDSQTRNKQWGFSRYAEVVQACPDIRFIRVTHADQRHLPGAEHIFGLQLVHMLGMVKNAAAVLVPEGGLHHAAAAFGTKAVVLFGSRVPVETLGYPDQVNLGTDDIVCGMHHPCNHCKAVWDRVTVEDVVAALRKALAP